MGVVYCGVLCFVCRCVWVLLRGPLVTFEVRAFGEGVPSVLGVSGVSGVFG